MEQLFTQLSALDPAELTFWQDFFMKFYRAFLYEDRWMQYLDGVGTTLLAEAQYSSDGITLDRYPYLWGSS